MKSFVWGALLFLAPVSFGCGAGARNTRQDNRQLEDKLDELRARSRADRQKIRDLENDVLEAREALASPTDEMIAARAVGQPQSTGYASDEVPGGLRVEPAFPMQGEAEVVGFDANGVEILYAGDALRAGSIRPDTRKYDLSPQPSTSASNAPVDTAPLTPLPTESPVIEVTGKDLPKVGSLVRQNPIPLEVAPSTGAAVPSGADPKQAYRAAYATLRRGDHETAVAAFRDFVAAYPEHEHADNAQYWLAEAHYDRRQYRTALVEFHRVVDRYPKGNKVPDALLKIGFCHLALGDRNAARAFLKNLVKYHPKSNSAALASGKLQGLRE